MTPLRLKFYYVGCRIRLLWHCMTHCHRPAFDHLYPDKSFCWDCDYQP
jgi:hypothetical protein